MFTVVKIRADIGAWRLPRSGLVSGARRQRRLRVGGGAAAGRARRDAMSRNTVIVTVSIDAPPEKVFAVLCDVERWPEWTSTMTGVERLESGPFAVGSSARVRQPRLRPAVWQVTEFENQRNFTWAARSPGLCMTAGHWIEPEGEGSRRDAVFRTVWLPRAADLAAIRRPDPALHNHRSARTQKAQRVGYLSDGGGRSRSRQ